MCWSRLLGLWEGGCRPLLDALSLSKSRLCAGSSAQQSAKLNAPLERRIKERQASQLVSKKGSIPGSRGRANVKSISWLQKVGFPRLSSQHVLATHGRAMQPPSSSRHVTIQFKEVAQGATWPMGDGGLLKTTPTRVSILGTAVPNFQILGVTPDGSVVVQASSYTTCIKSPNLSFGLDLGWSETFLMEKIIRDIDSHNLRFFDLFDFMY